MNFLVLFISTIVLLNKPERKRNNLEPEVLQIYLITTIFLTVISAFTDIVIDLGVQPPYQTQWLLLQEYCNQVFTCIEIYVFGYILFGEHLNKCLLLLLAVSLFFGATIIYALCLTGKIRWKVQLRIGELFAVVQLVIFSIVILIKIYLLYIKQSFFNYARLILLLAFLGYSVVSAPLLVLANYLNPYSYDYVSLLYGIHHFLWAVLILNIWYYLRGGFNHLRLAT